jgi:aminopeptidase N
MSNGWRSFGLLVALACFTSCGDSTVTVEPGVSIELARQRAAAINGVEYRLHFDIPADPEAPVSARAEIRFELAALEAPLQLDYRQEGSGLRSLRVNADPVEIDYRQEHILVPQSALRRGRNVIEIEFVADSASLNRNPGYLYTLFVPDRARTAFPLFDQPDIKARYELTLVVPEGWKAMSSAPLAGLSTAGGRSKYRFQRSERMSSYLFSFVAGEFDAITRRVNGRTMTMLHRETDEARLARNLDAIFDLHGASLSWMEQYTGIDHPYVKLDFALIPGHPYGGMEHVGAVQYRASKLLLDESPSDKQLLARAQLIAHETAHMWFGNLVTMRWFDDVWTKEVFANFMAGKIVNPAFKHIDHDLNFLASHYPPAYAVDRSEGANPIRQVLPNLREAGQMYGAIIYHKAPIMMRQLERLLGEEAFRQGMRTYLRRFSHGNASWPELIEILDAGTGMDLARWSTVWVNSPGRPHFSLVRQGGTLLHQEDPSGKGRNWPQRLSFFSLAGSARESVSLFSAGASTALPPLSSGDGAGFLFSADGLGYGLFPVDMGLFGHWSDLAAVARGSQLLNAWENLLEGEEKDVEGYLERLLAIVNHERDQLLLDLALDQLDFLYNSLLPHPRREHHGPSVESALWQALQPPSSPGRARMLFRAWARLISSEVELRRLHAIWTENMEVKGLMLGEEDRVELAEILAIRLPKEGAAIIRRQLDETANPDRKRRLEFLAPALSPDQQVRDAFFESLRDARNRRPEAWVADAAAILHHPARLVEARDYLLPSLELLQEIQVTGDIFFPSAWLHASFHYHHSPEAVRVVRDFLEQRPEYNRQLRMKVLQAADPMFRASRIRQELARAR